MESGQQGSVSLAVVPFDNLGDDADGAQDYFSRGFIDDLITDLSRFPELQVMAAHSAERISSPEPDPEGRPAPEVDYLLKGSIRRGAGRLRVTTQLVHPADHRVEWGGRFDAPLDDVFEVQDEITAQVVGSLSNRINASLLSAARRKPVTELPVYDCWLRGYDQLKAGTLAADEKARKLFEQALSIDPSYSRAYTGLSLSYFNEWSCQLWSRWDDNEQKAYEHAQRAHQLDADDHFARVVLGRVLLFRREFELAEPHFDRALQLNPNDADSLVQIAMAFAYLGRAREARATYERAVKLNPYHDPWYHAYGGVAVFACEDYGAALQHALRIPIDTMVDLAAYLAAGYQLLGQHERAREHVQIYLEQFQAKIAVGRELEPGEAMRWVKHVNPWRHAHDEERLTDNLRAAGLSGQTAPAPMETPTGSRSFRKVGSLWQVRFAGRDAHLPDLKGCADIALLLARPGQQVHCNELMGSATSGDGADDAIDDTARAAYRARAAELQQELAEAEEANDLGRSEKLRAELDALTEHLSQSLGLGGRSRKLGAPSERARSAVTWRIRSALKKIAEAHPELGEHLASAIQTGTLCSYAPADGQDLDWET